MPPDQVKPLLEWAAAQLAASGSGTPQLDARLLLQHVARLSREDLILDPARALSANDKQAFLAVIARRAAREPVSRIIGQREFYGRSFRVTPDVLDPRPDTETLVDAALNLKPPFRTVLDLGTGSGAIIATLLAERPKASGVAVDVSPAALEVAQANAQSLGIADRLTLKCGSWFVPVTGRFDLIVSNPPYIPRLEIATLAPDVRNFDPHLALVGGEDGLDPYRAIAFEARQYLEEGGRVLVEVGAGQAADVDSIFRACGLRPAGRHCDLAGHERCLEFAR